MMCNVNVTALLFRVQFLLCLLRINNKHLVLERLSLDWEEVMLSYQGTRRHRERGGPLVGQRFKSVAVRWWLVPVLRAVESIHRRRF